MGEEMRRGGAGSSPVIVKADADALVVDTVGGDFVAEPAFEKDDVTGFGGVGGVDAVFVAAARVVMWILPLALPLGEMARAFAAPLGALALAELIAEIFSFLRRGAFKAGLYLRSRMFSALKPAALSAPSHEPKRRRAAQNSD